jgi:SnoaL-like domain
MGMTDREAITDQIYRYCRAMDRIDADLGYTIWHENGTADYGANVFQGSGRDFIDHVCAQHRGTLNHSHQVTNIIIELDGDRAASESYCTANLRIMRGDVLTQISVWNRYIDSWSKRAGRWAIDHRIAVIDFDEMRAVAAMSQTSRGSRDRNDPSYSVLGKTV